MSNRLTKSTWSKPAWKATALGIMALAVGCQRGPVQAPVVGKVTFKGKPVAKARMMFVSNGGRPGYAVVDDEGHYEAYTIEAGDGVLVGMQTVTIAPRDNVVKASLGKDGEEIRGETPAGRNINLWWPEKYIGVMTTPLKINVEAGKTNEFNFELTD